MMLMEMAATGLDAVIVGYRWLGEAVRSDLSGSRRAMVMTGIPFASEGMTTWR